MNSVTVALILMKEVMHVTLEGIPYLPKTGGTNSSSQAAQATVLFDSVLIVLVLLNP